MDWIFGIVGEVVWPICEEDVTCYEFIKCGHFIDCPKNRELLKEGLAVRSYF